MKVELVCPDCRSVVRVDEVHAGKQVRCPICSCITQVPVDGTSVPEVVIGDSIGAHSGSSPSSKRAEPAPSCPTPVPVPPQPVEPQPVPRRRGVYFGFDQRIVLAFIWGVGSLVSNFMCCGPIVGCILAVIGLGNAAASRSRFKQSGVMLNLIGLTLSGGILFFKYFLHWWAGG